MGATWGVVNDFLINELASSLGREASLKAVLANVGQEMAVLHGLLGELEGEVNQRRQLAALLQVRLMIA